jgi:hypothetical protein
MALSKIRAQMRAVNPGIAQSRVEQIDAALKESDTFKALDILHPQTGKDIHKIVRDQRPKEGSFWSYIYLWSYNSLDSWAIIEHQELWQDEFKKMGLPADTASLHTYVIEMRDILQSVVKSE